MFGTIDYRVRLITFLWKLDLKSCSQALWGKQLSYGDLEDSMIAVAAANHGTLDKLIVSPTTMAAYNKVFGK
jgi:hypothetical protein